MIDLATKYQPADVEPRIATKWNDRKAFAADPTSDAPPYCIVIPPPNVTAALHMGHALNNTLQDILIRWRRMCGDNAVWIPGTDHAGIATQTVVDKRLQAEGKPALKDYKRMQADGQNGRDQFVTKVQAWKDEYEQRITDQLKAMGCSCDWDRQRFTMDDTCARAVREAFFRLFKDGLIYRGKRLVNWDPATQTALADDEVEMRDVDGHFWYMKYPVVEQDGSGGWKDTCQYATVATTRPETMLGDTAVAVNPNDAPRAAFIGKHCRVPIVNRIIPIVGDDYVVVPNPDSADEKAKFASGFLKVTPAHDPNDWEIGQRHKLDVINVMAPDGTISDQHGWPEEDIKNADQEAVPLGLDRYEAREAIVDWFRRINLLEEVRPYTHAVGHSYRSHVPIEPYLSDQWYVKVTDPRLAGAALRSMDTNQYNDAGDDKQRESKGADWENQLRFYPERYAKTFRGWHEGIRDWCISRQLWWGHQIPVWTGGTHVNDALESQLEAWAAEGRIATTTMDNGGDTNRYVCLKDNDPEVVTAIENHNYTRDPDVLDTWFSSALWPFSTLGWPGETAEMNTWNPGNVLCTAREIITLWVSRMVMTNLYFLDRLPFTDVFIHAMIQDGQGRKMSKSLGNGVDPLDIIHSHGSDAMRYTLASMTTTTQDVRMPVAKDPETGRNTSDKFDLGRNFANKLWNAVRFALVRLAEAKEQPADDTADEDGLTLADRWILSRLARTVRDTDAALQNYEFSSYAQGLYDFFWRDLCDWYIEAIKPTVAANASQQNVLALCIDASLRLLHPVMPFITEELWTHLNTVAPGRDDDAPDGVLLPPNDLLIRAPWPIVSDALIYDDVEADFALVQELVGAMRQVRTTHKVAPRLRIDFSAQAPTESAQRIENVAALIETLANVQTGEVGPNTQKPSDAVSTICGQAHLYLHGLLDADAERERLNKRLEEVNKSIGALKGRLANKKYVEKAPAHLVEETKGQLAAAEQEHGTLTEQLAAL